MGFLDKLWTMTDSLWQPKSKSGKKKNLAEHFDTPKEPKKKKKVVKRRRRLLRRKRRSNGYMYKL